MALVTARSLMANPIDVSHPSSIGAASVPAGRSEFIKLETPSQSAPEIHSHLVVLGYFDNLEQFISPTRYFFELDAALQLNGLVQSLLGDRFRLVSSSTAYQVFESDGHRIHFFDLNAPCPTDRMDLSNGKWVRAASALCTEQLRAIQGVIQFLRSAVENRAKTQFSSFTFIGHSRMGTGLGFGPFQREYTMSLSQSSLGGGLDQNDAQSSPLLRDWIEQTSIQRIHLLACESQPHYQRYFQSGKIRFKGYDKDLVWSPFPERNSLHRETVTHLVPFILNDSLP